VNDLRDKVAIITGASSGIGRATALALARQGARVVLAARRQAELEAVAREVWALGREALVVATDVAEQAQVERLVAETLRCWGQVDLAVASAGVYVRKAVAGLTADLVEVSMRVNFYGALYLVLATLPHLRAQGSGHIVLVSSMDGKKGIPPDGPYVMAKFALAGLGDVLRQELHGTGVDVSIIFPGRVDTPMIANLEVPWISAKIPPEAVARAILGAVRHRRAEVIVPFQARLLLYLDWLSPRLGDWAVRFFRLEGWEDDDYCFAVNRTGSGS
jgi:NAD(P)-dependent dehydrogenase (short-subunit alcohol dehydrogenase family)